jgi:hypothetical protein
MYKDPKPQVDQIVWKIVPEANTMMAAMQARQADVTYYPPHFSVDTMKRVPGITVQQQKDYIYDVFVGFRVNKPVVDDPAIRRAANMAISQEAIAKAVYFGYGTPLRSLLSPAVVDFDAKAAAMMPPYDPAGAAKVLDEAGWKPGPDGIRVKNGQRATFLTYGLRNDTGPRITEAIQADLRRIGIDMQIQLWDATVGWGKLATQEFDAFILSYPYGTATEALNLARSASTRRTRSASRSRTRAASRKDARTASLPPSPVATWRAAAIRVASCRSDADPASGRPEKTMSAARPASISRIRVSSSAASGASVRPSTATEPPSAPISCMDARSTRIPSLSATTACAASCSATRRSASGARGIGWRNRGQDVLGRHGPARRPRAGPRAPHPGLRGSSRPACSDARGPGRVHAVPIRPEVPAEDLGQLFLGRE